jgi:hypothetical protein
MENYKSLPYYICGAEGTENPSSGFFDQPTTAITIPSTMYSQLAPLFTVKIPNIELPEINPMIAKMMYITPTVFNVTTAFGFDAIASKTIPTIIWIMLDIVSAAKMPSIGLETNPQTPAIINMIPKTKDEVFAILFNLFNKISNVLTS